VIRSFSDPPTAEDCENAEVFGASPSPATPIPVLARKLLRVNPMLILLFFINVKAIKKVTSLDGRR
jgi:hypothetical protein